MDPGKSMGRAALAGVALGAAALNQFLLLFPLGLMFALPALWFGNGFIMGASALGFVLMAWIVQPARAEPLDELPRASAPALHVFVDEIADRMEAPRAHALVLDDEPNAAAAELNRGFSLRPVRRVLVLGRPLLATLDRETLAAVIAHEFGHFSRRHGRLGHWLYRTRAAWLAHLEASADPELSAWERAGIAFAQRFVPWFARASLAQARRDEFEADALAASAFGAEALGRALQQVDDIARRWAVQRDALRVECQAHEPEPPADWLARLAARLCASPAEPASDDGKGTDPMATHPPTAKRLEALALRPSAAAWPAPDAAAGPLLLGDAWPSQLAEASRRDAAGRHAWRGWHVLLSQLSMRARSVRPDDDSDEGLCLAARFGDDKRRAAAAARRVQRDPQDAPALWHQADAMARLGSGPGLVQPLLEACIVADPAWAVPARAVLAQLLARDGAPAAARAGNEALLDRALARRAAAADRMREALAAGRCKPATLPAAAREALAAALRSHPSLRAAWCVALEARLDERRAYRGLGLVLRSDPQAQQAEGVSDDQLRLHGEALLGALADPDTIVLTALRFTTESRPAELVGRPELCLFDTPGAAPTQDQGRDATPPSSTVRPRRPS